MSLENFIYFLNRHSLRVRLYAQHKRSCKRHFTDEGDRILFLLVSVAEQDLCQDGGSDDANDASDDWNKLKKLNCNKKI
jgi:hypothetical protein